MARQTQTPHPRGRLGLEPSPRVCSPSLRRGLALVREARDDATTPGTVGTDSVYVRAVLCKEGEGRSRQTVAAGRSHRHISSVVHAAENGGLGSRLDCSPDLPKTPRCWTWGVIQVSGKWGSNVLCRCKQDVGIWVPARPTEFSVWLLDAELLDEQRKGQVEMDVVVIGATY